MRVNYKKLKETYGRLPLARANRLFRECLGVHDGPQGPKFKDDGQYQAEDFSIEALAKEMLGREIVESWDPRAAGDPVMVHEAGSAVDSTAFANITGQIVYSAILQAYQQEAFVCTNLISTTPTKLSGEKIPGIGLIGDKSDTVGEGDPYPRAGIAEDYIETPSTTKRGIIVPVTKEAIFFDRTNLVLQRARQVGEALGLQKEKRACDLIAGITNNHSWKGAAYDTYATATGAAQGEAGGTGLVINKLTGNEMVDWTDVDNAEQLFADILDPNTSEPVVVSPTDVLVCPAYRKATARVFNATEIRYTDTGAKTETVSANPIVGQYTMHVSRQLYRRIIYNGGGTAVSAANAKKYWYMGDFKRAFTYMQNWPITVTQAPPNAADEFDRDIVFQFKASEMGVFAALNPRFVVKSTG